MAKSPESRYIDKIHRQIDSDIWRIRMQMGMGAPRGIPDILYRGEHNDLWVEYKLVDDLTKTRLIPWRKVSEHQIDWLVRARKLTLDGKDNVNEVAVIVGDKQGKGYTLWPIPIAIENRTKITLDQTLIKTPKEIAKWIEYMIK